MSWQGIETAPKDGTRFLGWSAVDDVITVTFWGRVGGFTPSRDGRTWLGEAWSDHRGKPDAWEPTHWCALPSPPEVEPALPLRRATDA
ncbi:DUF551 domain-containing protein [Roseomonas sp. BN140053]|uniref:DUF551 domain-containing protein n=1 Tax=Roseomonas sp. BN140053 TaxID=3391898 RepID=UPI0039E815B7